MVKFAHHRPSLCTSFALLVYASRESANAFRVSTGTSRRPLESGTSSRLTATSAIPSTTHALQRVWDELTEVSDLGNIEKLMVEVETALFPQSPSWAKTWTPMRCVVAEVPDGQCISILVLPREYLVLPCFELPRTIPLQYFSPDL